MPKMTKEEFADIVIKRLLKTESCWCPEDFKLIHTKKCCREMECKDCWRNALKTAGLIGDEI